MASQSSRETDATNATFFLLPGTAIKERGLGEGGAAGRGWQQERLQERKKESLLAEAVLSVEAGDEAGPPVTV